MAKIIARFKGKMPKGYLFFVDKAGDVSAVKMNRKGAKKSTRTRCFAETPRRDGCS